MKTYWRLERRKYDETYIVRGAAGEQVSLDTRRQEPSEELEAIANALNTLPAYQVNDRPRG